MGDRDRGLQGNRLNPEGRGRLSQAEDLQAECYGKQETKTSTKALEMGSDSFANPRDQRSRSAEGEELRGHCGRKA